MKQAQPSSPNVPVSKNDHGHVDALPLNLNLLPVGALDLGSRAGPLAAPEARLPVREPLAGTPNRASLFVALGPLAGNGDAQAALGGAGALAEVMPSKIETQLPIVLSGIFDVFGERMQKGELAVQTSQTFEARVAELHVKRKQQLDAALDELAERAWRIATDERLPSHSRLRELFGLWDDLDEAAVEARQLVTNVTRASLPQTPEAQRELDGLNRGKTVPFRPFTVDDQWPSEADPIAASGLR